MTVAPNALAICDCHASNITWACPPDENTWKMASPYEKSIDVELRGVRRLVSALKIAGSPRRILRYGTGRDLARRYTKAHSDGTAQV
jgi:hypothetical protein